jgi:hypothetical protein
MVYNTTFAEASVKFLAMCWWIKSQNALPQFYYCSLRSGAPENPAKLSELLVV